MMFFSGPRCCSQRAWTSKMFSLGCITCTQAVRFLLDYVDRRQVYQALLAAINVGNEEIAETIIEHPKYDEINMEMSKQRGGFQQCSRFNDDNQFSEEITPLILASQQNRFEVHLLHLLCTF